MSIDNSILKIDKPHLNSKSKHYTSNSCKNMQNRVHERLA